MKTFSKSIFSMASTLEVALVLPEDQEKRAEEGFEMAYAEADRLIQIINAWKEGTELYEVNQNAGIAPVKVSSDLYQLVKRSLKISELTDGLFDVTFASIDKVWYFDKPLVSKPTEEEIKRSVRNINFRFVQLNDQERSIYISNKGTKIELGAIGKGFVANRMKAILQKEGFQSGMVNAGGDLVVWGQNHWGKPWRIGVADPNQKDKHLAFLPLNNEAVATSGNYERFAVIDGEKYSHIIHPKTGYPVKGIKSVTVISPDVELCDAIATSVFLLGVDRGLAFINQYEDLKCFIIDEHDEFFFSENLIKKHYAQYFTNH